MKVEVRDGKMLIELEMLSSPKASSSHKTLIVCSTFGNKPTDITVKGRKVMLGVNAYIPKD